MDTTSARTAGPEDTQSAPMGVPRTHPTQGDATQGAGPVDSQAGPEDSQPSLPRGPRAASTKAQGGSRMVGQPTSKLADQPPETDGSK